MFSVFCENTAKMACEGGAARRTLHKKNARRLDLPPGGWYNIFIMKKIKITVMKKARHEELIALYENPIKNACDIKEGQTFLCEELKKPEGLCESAWESMLPFAMTLAYGGENIYGGWMKNSRSAMVSCNDGFRPVSFYLEALD